MGDRRPDLLRGEIALDLGGRERIARMSWVAAEEIERVTGDDIVALLRRINGFDCRISDFAAVMTAALREAGTAVRHEEVLAWIAQAGMIRVTAPVLFLLCVGVMDRFPDIRQSMMRFLQRAQIIEEEEAHTVH